LKAVILKNFGGPEVLRFEDLPQPKPAAGEALIKIHSVSVNRTLDCVVRAGKYPVKIRLPHVLGADPAGEVVEVGAAVATLNVGDRVAVISAAPCKTCEACLRGDESLCVDGKRIGIDRWGGYAEYIAVPALCVVRIPTILHLPRRRSLPVTFRWRSIFSSTKPASNPVSAYW